jgi:hypothetical protein
MAADDLMETVNGSYGITGAVDTVLIMASKAGGSVLDIRGRDVESAELAMRFSKDSCRWTVLGVAEEILLSDQRKAMIAALDEHGGPMKVTELVAATGMKRNPLELLLGRMVRDGLIKRTGPGCYAHKDYVEPARPNAADKRKSVRSVPSVSPARQTKDELQAADSAQEREGICLSVRSVRKFTGRADVLGSVVECVKTQTDQADGQIKAQAIEAAEKSDSENLSDLQTDQTDRMLTDDKAAHEERRGEAATADDLSISEWLLRREPLCAQCRLPGGTEWDYDDLKVRLHPHCERPWIEAHGEPYLAAALAKERAKARALGLVTDDGGGVQ